MPSIWDFSKMVSGLLGLISLSCPARCPGLDGCGFCLCNKNYSVVLCLQALRAAEEVDQVKWVKILMFDDSSQCTEDLFESCNGWWLKRNGLYRPYSWYYVMFWGKGGVTNTFVKKKSNMWVSGELSKQISLCHVDGEVDYKIVNRRTISCGFTIVTSYKEQCNPSAINLQGINSETCLYDEIWWPVCWYLN